MTINRVKAAITDKAKSADELKKEFGFSHSTATRSLARLRGDGLSFIESWHLPLGCTHLAARHRLDNLPDAVKPSVDELLAGRDLQLERVQLTAERLERMKPTRKVPVAANDPCSFWVLRKEA